MIKPFYEAHGQVIYHGDCLDVLRELPDGCARLIYVDPPFNTGKVQQRTRLRTAALMRLVEQRRDLRIVAQQHLVKMGDQSFTAAFQQRDSGFNDGALGIGEHGSPCR